MAGIYNPWANPETDETLTGMFATPDLMAAGNPLGGGSAGGLEHEPTNEADDELEDASDPAEASEDLADAETEAPEDAPIQQALAVIQQQGNIIQQLLATLKA